MTDRLIHRFDLVIKLESPFMTAGTEVTSITVDTSLLRNHEGKLILPGSQVRGVYRDLFEKAKIEQYKDLFGTSSATLTDNSPNGDNPFAPNRRRLHFSDLICTTDETNPLGTTTRIEINPETGSVRKGALQVIEMPFPYGAEVTFSGTIMLIGNDTEANSFLNNFNQFKDFVPAIGGAKTAGFGNILSIELTKKAEKDQVDCTFETDAEQVFMELTFNEPFLVNAKHIGTNVFEGSSVVPGSVIKGALAHQLTEQNKLSEELGDALSKIRISQALPTDSDQTTIPRAIALSYFSDGEEIYDYFGNYQKWESLCTKKVLSFASDWKDKTWIAAAQKCNWPEPTELHSRTRTKIESDTYVADEGNLFVHRAVSPGSLKWRFSISRQNAEKKEFKQLVETLLSHPLWPIGKTSASAVCKVCNHKEPNRSISPDEDGVWRITLQSPANLIPISKAYDKELDIQNAYLEYWQNMIALYHHDLRIVENSFQVLSYETLQGGYQSRRYPQIENKYSPYILTQPGTVFVIKLDGEEDHAQALFERLCSEGILPCGSDSFEDWARWQDTPYPRQNGFGEITADWHDVAVLEVTD